MGGRGRRGGPPPAPAVGTLWATNPLARLDPERLAQLVEAVAELRRAQLRDPGPVFEALKRQRTQLDSLVDAARQHMAAHGFKVTPSALMRRA